MPVRDRDEGTTWQQVNITLPPETIRLLDGLKDGSLRSRSAVVNHLIEQAAVEREQAEATA